MTGKLSSQSEEDKLMHSVMEGDKESVEKGKLITDSINKGLNNFQPSTLFENLVNDYKRAEKLYGKTILRAVTGHDASELQKNIKFPEFKRVLEQDINSRFQSLKKEGILDEEGNVAEVGYKLASVVLYLEELENIIPKGDLGNFSNKIISPEGMRDDIKKYQKGDKYRDIALKQSVKKALRRGHLNLEKEDLTTFNRRKSGNKEVIFVLDSSGSMQGKKLEYAKKAGVALAHKSIEARDKIGLVVFSSSIKSEVAPTNEISEILHTIIRVRPSKETNLSKAISKAREMFSKKNSFKHMILLTDAVPTVGKDPEKNVLSEASISKEENVSISIVGIDLDDKGKELGEKISGIAEGRFYMVKALKDMDQIVLMDYAAF
jgi:Mg-chelatase subunit ChlD